MTDQKRGALAQATDRVAGAGRLGDDMIVHMSQEEFENLRHIWGDPTINPETGMPEYFKLGKVFKSVVNWALPIAVTALTGNPALGALASGVATKATGGSWKDALLNAGMQYGGAKLAQGFSMNPTDGGGLFSIDRISNPLSDFRNIGTDLSSGYDSALGGLGLQDAGGATEGVGMSQEAAKALAVSPPELMSPSAYPPRDTLGDYFTVNKNSILAGGALAALGAMGGEPEMQEKSGSAVSGYNPGPLEDYEYAYDFSPIQGDYLTYGYGPENDFFRNARYIKKAAGGAIGSSGALSQVSRYFAGGEGSGRSDKLHAMVSPKEYVMDAETVALAGDGNPDEGAKKLDALRKNLRRHKGKALAQGKFSPDAKPLPSYMKRA